MKDDETTRYRGSNAEGTQAEEWVATIANSSQVSQSEKDKYGITAMSRMQEIFDKER